MHYTIPITQRLKKLVRSLHQKQFRDQNDLFIAEGFHLVEELQRSKYVPELLVCKDSPAFHVIDVLDKFADRGTPIYSAPKHQFDQMCDTKTPQGVIAVINKAEQNVLNDESFIALDGVSDPGNVGTIIRTADWFGYKQIILGRDCADLYNPKVVRATQGAIFRTNIIYAPELADFIKENFKKFKFYGASIDAESSMTKFRPKTKYGIFFGSEAKGFSSEVEELIHNHYKIEGLGKSESLNVAVSVGISLYHFAGKKAK